MPFYPAEKTLYLISGIALFYYIYLRAGLLNPSGMRFFDHINKMAAHNTTYALAIRDFRCRDNPPFSVCRSQIFKNQVFQFLYSF